MLAIYLAIGFKNLKKFQLGDKEVRTHNKSIAASGRVRWTNRLQIAIRSSVGLTIKSRQKFLYSNS
jgi:hypothetical protein